MMLDWLFPRDCELCGKPVDRRDRQFCTDCLNRVPFIPLEGLCRICGRAVEGYSGEYLCDDCKCRSTRPAFDIAASAISYESRFRELIHAYKFNRAFYLRNDFCDWMEAAGRSRFPLADIDFILPMPTTLWHRFDRGYSQTVYLAKELARRFERPYAANLLRRCGHPRRQAGLSEAERRENVKGTFAVHHVERVHDRTLLLIDDIMTTGSTLSAAAEALKSAGAKKVRCLTLARSLHT